MYNPCKTVTQDEFSHYFDNLSENSIICEDQNAHHPMWALNSDSRTYLNTSGTNLANTIMQSTRFTLLTPSGTPTYLNKNLNTQSTIDLVFGSGFFSHCDKIQVENMLGSDHFPIAYCFRYIPDKDEKVSPQTLDFSRLDWNNIN